MKTITLQEAYNIIENCYAVIIDDDGLCYPSQYELNGEPDNEWLYCSWDDGEYHEYSLKFIEDSEGQEIKFDGESIYMLDSEGDECKITPLVKMKKEVESVHIDGNGVVSLM